VILGNDHDILAPIREMAPDMLVFGYDQRVPEDRIREMFPGIELRRVGGYETDRYKSSILRQSRSCL
jgi:glycerol-3-phosphate cytidylyltransferase-like family protein